MNYAPKGLELCPPSKTGGGNTMFAQSAKGECLEHFLSLMRFVFGATRMACGCVTHRPFLILK